MKKPIRKELLYELSLGLSPVDHPVLFHSTFRIAVSRLLAGTAGLPGKNSLSVNSELTSFSTLARSAATVRSAPSKTSGEVVET
jgi:hypothetical protein